MSKINGFSALRALGVCLAGAALLASCSKNNNGNPGTSGNYQPDSAGATWNYSVQESFNPSQSLILAELEDSGYQFNAFDTSFTAAVVSTGTDTTIGGIQYNVLTINSQPGMFFSQQDSLYYSINLLPELSVLGGGFTPNNELNPVIYLKTEGVGATWTQYIAGSETFQSQTFPDTTFYTFTVQSVGGTRTVNGKSYTNVVTVQVSILDEATEALLAQNGGLTGVDLSIPGTYYFAENVGLIEADITSATWGLSFTQQLQSYTE